MLVETVTRFFSSLFVPQEFIARLLSHSFHQPEGWVELFIALACMVAAFVASRMARSSLMMARLRPMWWQHIVRRLSWPVLTVAAGIAASAVWETFGYSAVWLRFLLLAAYWMVIIRTVVAVLHAALPKHHWSATLENVSASVLWLWFVLWISGLENRLTEWMKSLEIPFGSNPISLYTALTGLLSVGVLLVLMLWISKWISAKLMAADSLDMSLRIVLSKVIRTLLIVLSVLIALPLVGINLSVLSVFGGALGVGIGFGLQKIASNYISGFIILADRSIRLGDRLTVNEFTGNVVKMTPRFVVLRSPGGQDALIPNETFVTDMVVNDSYTSRALYQFLDVQVAYKTDLEQAMQIMLQAASAQERVSQEQPPSALLVGFGDNGVNLRIGFWVKDPENGFGSLFSAILMNIWQEFNAAGIEFPFPQREVRILGEQGDES